MDVIHFRNILGHFISLNLDDVSYTDYNDTVKNKECLEIFFKNGQTVMRLENDIARKVAIQTGVKF